MRVTANKALETTPGRRFGFALESVVFIRQFSGVSYIWRSAASHVMRNLTPLVAMLLLLASGTRSFALGYERSQVEHDWAIDGPGGRYGLVQFAPYGPLVGRRTLVIFAGHSQEIPLTAPWAAALLGVFTFCGSFAVLCWSRRET